MEAFTHRLVDIWGTADVKAAIAAISNWIENIGWHGPGVLLRDWIVIGHSNGGMLWVPKCDITINGVETLKAREHGFFPLTSQIMSSRPHQSLDIPPLKVRGSITSIFKGKPEERQRENYVKILTL